MYNKHYKEFKEKTGFTAAKWLVDYCIDNNKEVPKFNVHSANPVGANNIRSFLNNFILYYPKIKESLKEMNRSIDGGDVDW